MIVRRGLGAAGIVLLASVATGCDSLCRLNNSCKVPSDCSSTTPTSPSGSCDSGGGSTTVKTGSNVLSIAPVYQQTLVWCWLASAEMVFRYYNVPPVNGISYQCGIMGTVAGPNSVCFYNCALCMFGSGSDAASAQVLRQYPQILQTYFFPQIRIPQIDATLYERRLSMTEIQREIDAGHPIELGITPQGPFQGQAAHDVVLIGYNVPNTATQLLTINDPAPYDLVASPAQNPYRLAGATQLQPYQYQISYASLSSALQWSASITTAAR